MIRSLFRPSLLCSTARNLRHFSKHPSSRFDWNILPLVVNYGHKSKSFQFKILLLISYLWCWLSGRSRIKVRFGGEFNINSMAAPASRAMEQMVSENEEQEQISKLLTGMNDEHGGVIVEMTTEPMDTHVFASLLRASISHWRQQVKWTYGCNSTPVHFNADSYYRYMKNNDAS